MSKRVYCNGAPSRALLVRQLGEGFVLTDVVSRGQGWVAYFRHGTQTEIEECRSELRESEQTKEMK